MKELNQFIFIILLWCLSLASPGSFRIVRPTTWWKHVNLHQHIWRWMLLASTSRSTPIIIIIIITAAASTTWTSKLCTAYTFRYRTPAQGQVGSSIWPSQSPLHSKLGGGFGVDFIPNLTPIPSKIDKNYRINEDKEQYRLWCSIFLWMKSSTTVLGHLFQEVLHISGHKNDSVSITLQFTILVYLLFVCNTCEKSVTKHNPVAALQQVQTSPQIHFFAPVVLLFHTFNLATTVIRTKEGHSPWSLLLGAVVEISPILSNRMGLGGVLCWFQLWD